MPKLIRIPASITGYSAPDSPLRRPPYMDGTSLVVKKQEDGMEDAKGGEKRDIKPAAKTLNRVPRTFVILSKCLFHSLLS